MKFELDPEYRDQYNRDITDNIQYNLDKTAEELIFTGIIQIYRELLDSGMNIKSPRHHSLKTKNSKNNNKVSYLAFVDGYDIPVVISKSGESGEEVTSKVFVVTDDGAEVDIDKVVLCRSFIKWLKKHNFVHIVYDKLHSVATKSMISNISFFVAFANFFEYDEDILDLFNDITPDKKMGIINNMDINYDDNETLMKLIKPSDNNPLF